MFTVWPKSCLYNGFDRGCDAYMDRDLILEPWYLPRSSSDVIPISPFTTRFVWYPHQPWVYALYWLAILNVVILLAYLHQGVGVCLCKDHNKKVFICTEFFHLQGKPSFICFKTETYGKKRSGAIFVDTVMEDSQPGKLIPQSNLEYLSYPPLSLLTLFGGWRTPFDLIPSPTQSWLSSPKVTSNPRFPLKTI